MNNRRIKTHVISGHLRISYKIRFTCVHKLANWKQIERRRKKEDYGRKDMFVRCFAAPLIYFGE